MEIGASETRRPASWIKSTSHGRTDSCLLSDHKALLTVSFEKKAPLGPRGNSDAEQR
jgi:hypothetical protein